MSSPDPSSTTPGTRGNGANGGSGSGTNGSNGHGVTPSVAVGAGVEKALADVQRQLVRQAATLRAPSGLAGATPVTLVTAPVAPAAPAPPRERPAKAPKPPRQRRAAPPPPPPTVAPVPVGPIDDDLAVDDELLIDDTELVDVVDDEPGSAPVPVRRVRPATRARVERRIDLDELTRAERAALGSLQARKVRRIVRDISPWSVFKFSVLFYVCVWLIVLVAGIILWKVGQDTGVIANIEKFYAKAAGEQSFELDGRQVFRAGATSGAILVAAATGVSVLVVALFNLISDLTGGIRLSVVELESARRPLRRRASASAVAQRARAGADPAPVGGGDDDPGAMGAGTGAERARPTGASPADAPDATGPSGATPSGDASTTEQPSPAVPDLVPGDGDLDEADRNVASGTR